MINTICYFEIPGDDLDGLKEFYESMFSWSFEKISGQFPHYSIDTGEGSPKGGLTARQDSEHTPVTYVKVESVDRSLVKAQELGASVSVPKKPVPGYGWYAVVRDPQGNRVGLWQDDPGAGR